MTDIARADGGRCPRCGARCGCGGAAVLATQSVCARRAAFARAPSSPLRLVRPLAPAGADGGAVGAQKAARPSWRARCAPPVAACVRRSRAAAAVGRSAARSPLNGLCSGGSCPLAPCPPPRPRPRPSARQAAVGGLARPFGRLRRRRSSAPAPRLALGAGAVAFMCPLRRGCARCGGREKVLPWFKFRHNWSYSP